MEVKAINKDKTLKGSYSIDLSDQANGIYSVKIITDKQTVVEKIIISQ